MRACIKCGGVLASTELDGICYPCEKKLSSSELAALTAQVEAFKTQEEIRHKEEIFLTTKMLLTTETYPVGLEITDRLEIVTAECVFGMNVFKDFFVGMTDIVGGRSGTTQKIFRDARNTVLRELREEAFSVGGNAVIGVSIQYSQLDAKGTSMIMVVATGTAVLIPR